jgi:hypothetical protein
MESLEGENPIVRSIASVTRSDSSFDSWGTRHVISAVPEALFAWIVTIGPMKAA